MEKFATDLVFGGLSLFFLYLYRRVRKGDKNYISFLTKGNKSIAGLLVPLPFIAYGIVHFSITVVWYQFTTQCLPRFYGPSILLTLLLGIAGLVRVFRSQQEEHQHILLRIFFITMGGFCLTAMLIRLFAFSCVQ